MNVSLSYAARTWGIYAALVLMCLLFMSGASGSVILTILNIAVLLGFLRVRKRKQSGRGCCGTCTGFENCSLCPRSRESAK